jgi:hypothetical protein
MTMILLKNFDVSVIYIMVVKKNAQMKRDFQLTMSQTQLKRDRERTGRKGEQKKERETKQSSRSNDNT